jgi:hypothetical protein
MKFTMRKDRMRFAQCGGLPMPLTAKAAAMSCHRPLPLHTPKLLPIGVMYSERGGRLFD